MIGRSSLALVLLATLGLPACDRLPVVGPWLSRRTSGLDGRRAVTRTVRAAEGGAIALETEKGIRATLTIPENALAQDATLVATPAAKRRTNPPALAADVELELKGGAAKAPFLLPLVLTYSLAGSAPPGATIVRYRGKGPEYDIVTTRALRRGGKTLLVAELSSLSRYGVLAAPGAQGRSQNAWSIDFSSMAHQTADVWSLLYTLEFSATGAQPELPGNYRGPATLQQQGKAKVQQPLPFFFKGDLGSVTSTGDASFSLASSGDQCGPWKGQGSMQLQGGANLDILAKSRQLNVPYDRSRRASESFPFTVTVTSGSASLELARIGTFRGRLRPPACKDGGSDGPLKPYEGPIGEALRAAGYQVGPDSVTVYQRGGLVCFTAFVGEGDALLPNMPCVKQLIGAGKIPPCTLEGGRTMITGCIQTAGGRTQVTARTVDVETGAVQGAGKGQAEGTGARAAGEAAKTAAGSLGGAATGKPGGAAPK